MTVKFISNEELDGIAESLPPDFCDCSDTMQEFEYKGIEISVGREWQRI
jgi:hypothetical protein